MTNCDEILKKMRKSLYMRFLLIVFFITLAVILTKQFLFVIIIGAIIIIALIKEISMYKIFKNQKLLPLSKKLNNELKKVIVENGQYIFTENYIINIRSYWILNYNDILLIHKQESVENGQFDTICTRIYLITKTSNLSLILYSSSDVSSDFDKAEIAYNYMISKCVNALNGASKENIRQIENKYGIKVSKKWKSKAKWKNG